MSEEVKALAAMCIIKQTTSLGVLQTIKEILDENDDLESAKGEIEMIIDDFKSGKLEILSLEQFLSHPKHKDLIDNELECLRKAKKVAFENKEETINLKKKGGVC